MSALLAAVTALAASSVGSAAPTPAFTRVTAIGVGGFPTYGMARTADGTLHLIFQTTAPGSSAPNGLATRSISPAGALGPQQTALTGWAPGIPGLAALPNGSLEAVFGAVQPQASSIWGIGSSDGGNSWSQPEDVGGGSPEEALAYSANVTMQAMGSTPVLALNMAGGLVIQQGFGQGSPAQPVLDSTDNFAGNVNSAVDGGTGQVVTSWQSLAGSGGSFVRAVAPSAGTAQKAPGQLRDQLVIAGRDSGPGVFAAYTPDNNSVRLLRYGGGSVAVGKVAGVNADRLGVATGLGGRIWVMWGSSGGGLAITRSNKAVTRFEPIQHLAYQTFTLYRLAGDGRLGPLDLLVDEIPVSKSGPVPSAGTFYGRVLPQFSATASVKAVKNKKGKVTAYKVTVHVSDAGDPVAGATASVSGKKGKTAGNGTAKLTLPAAKGKSGTLTVAAAGYQTLTEKIKL